GDEANGVVVIAADVVELPRFWVPHGVLVVPENGAAGALRLQRVDEVGRLQLGPRSGLHAGGELAKLGRLPLDGRRLTTEDARCKPEHPEDEQGRNHSAERHGVLRWNPGFQSGPVAGAGRIPAVSQASLLSPQFAHARIP